MSLTLVKKRDGSLALGRNHKGKFPDEHAFPSSKVTQLALAGNLQMTEPDEDGKQFIVLTFGKDSAKFELVHSPDEDPDPGQPDAWVLKRVKGSTK